MIRDTLTSRLRFAGCALLLAGCALLLAWAAPSCAPQVGQVSGKVTYQGVPLPFGSIVFVNAEGNVVGKCAIANGQYVMTDVPTGSVKVAVESHERVPPGLGGVPGSYVLIPPRYRKAETSGLGYSVTRGSQTFNLDLSP
jgi:hypothetical protein